MLIAIKRNKRWVRKITKFEVTTLATETQTYWVSEYGLCNKFDYKKDFFLKAKEWETLQTFELEQLLYLGSNLCILWRNGTYTPRWQ